MRYGLLLPNFGDLGDARVLAAVGRDAERAGWDGLFLWDHVLLGPTPVVDPWVALAAIALSTRRIRIGTVVTPVPRRRPLKLARETVSVERLSGGRLVLGVGTGDGRGEWELLGEEADPRVRGAMLDEALDLLARLWGGEPVLHDGPFYRVGGEGPDAGGGVSARFLPRPLQSPRIPIWVAGVWPHKPPFRRAARWDGVVPRVLAGRFSRAPEASELAAVVAYVRTQRAGAAPFDVVTSGRTSGDDRAKDADVVAPHAEAGATWWLEDVNPWVFGWRDEGPWPSRAMRERVRRGPPAG